MNEKDIYIEARKWLESGLTLGKATVIETWGSSPRPVGSAMIVNERNGIIGSVSGGCIESYVFGKLLETIKTKKHSTVEFGVSNSQAWEVGLTCGGRIRLLLEYLDDKYLVTMRRINIALSKDPGIIEATRLKDGKRISFKNEAPFPEVNKDFYFITSRITKKRQSLISFLNKEEWFFKSYHSKITIVIVGAVHISESLIDLAKTVGFETILVDPRNYFDKKKFEKKIKVYNDWPDEALKKMSINNSFAIVTLTHDPKLDDPAIEFSLNTDAFYIGCLGSIKTHENRKKRLIRILRRY